MLPCADEQDRLQAARLLTSSLEKHFSHGGQGIGEVHPSFWKVAKSGPVRRYRRVTSRQGDVSVWEEETLSAKAACCGKLGSAMASGASP